MSKGTSVIETKQGPEVIRSVPGLIEAWVGPKGERFFVYTSVLVKWEDEIMREVKDVIRERSATVESDNDVEDPEMAFCRARLTIYTLGG